MAGYSLSAGTNDWLTELAGIRQTHKQFESINCVLVTVLHTRGSAPRPAGTRMLVLPDRCVGTIGGGHLEASVIDQCRVLAVCPEQQQNPDGKILRIPLGATLGQCCGGHVVLLLERISQSDSAWIDAAVQLQRSGTRALIITAIPGDGRATLLSGLHNKLIVTQFSSTGTLGSPAQDMAATMAARSMLAASGVVKTQWHNGLIFDPVTAESFHLLLFGAGHVGQALVNVLQPLPGRIDWIDSRVEMLSTRTLPSHVRAVITDEPADEIDAAPPDCYVLVMTHSHQLDLAICETALKRMDFAFCGLIGSDTKRRRFLQRLDSKGLSQAALERLVCPIGITGVTGKHPAQIAVAVAAQLLLLISQNEQRLLSALEDVS